MDADVVPAPEFTLLAHHHARAERGNQQFPKFLFRANSRQVIIARLGAATVIAAVKDEDVRIAWALTQFEPAAWNHEVGINLGKVSNPPRAQFGQGLRERRSVEQARLDFDVPHFLYPSLAHQRRLVSRPESLLVCVQLTQSKPAQTRG